MSKKELLLKPSWSYKDIAEYFGYSNATSINIKKKAYANGGAIKYSTTLVTTESVLALFGTTRETELRLYENQTTQTNQEDCM